MESLSAATSHMEASSLPPVSKIARSKSEPVSSDVVVPLELVRGSSLPAESSGAARLLMYRRLENGLQRFTDNTLKHMLECRSPVASGTEQPSAVLPSSHSPSAEGFWVCGICMDEFPSEEKANVAVCVATEADCPSTFCTDCMQQHFMTVLSGLSGLPALPPVRCPAVGCRRRVSTQEWCKLVDRSVSTAYYKGCCDILSLRCNACDETNSLFAKLVDYSKVLHTKVTVVHTYASSIQQYVGKTGTVIEVLEEDGQYPFKVEFTKEDGSKKDEKFALYELAFKSAVSDREALSKKFYEEVADEDKRESLHNALASFESGHCSPEHLLQVLAATFDRNVADMRGGQGDPQMWQFLQLIADPERRCVLQLACLRENPKILTPCCKAQYCWKCKISSYHEGRTCEEVQRAELDREVEFCPACGVATLRTEGCNQISCLCGHSWNWQGHDPDPDSD
mmetsp:Transcript_8948/g.14833  ORF Transcript_8948/g.14833 Transcript_8948/m.14833 type:complete len:453 (-) Transcript_8948:29-1387(-)